MPPSDPMRTFLREIGAPAHVVEAGLPGLVTFWEQFALEVERGYDLGLDDYLNDLDARTLIAACLDAAATDPQRFASPPPPPTPPTPPDSGQPHASASPTHGEPGALGELGARVVTADARVRRFTAARPTCLWGEVVAARRGWSASTHWWYFRTPKKLLPTLGEDLGRD